MVTNTSDLLATAIQHHRCGRLKQARSICHRILRYEPHNAEANHIFGLLAHQIGDSGTAVRSIRKAIAACPTSALYHFNLGVVLAANGDIDAAAESYRQALATKPDFGDAHNNLGVLLQTLGKVNEAQAHFERATRLNANHAEAWVNLGRTMLDKGDPVSALAHFTRVLDLNAGLAEAHFGVGKCHEDQRNWKDAEASYRTALSLKPEFAEAQNNLGTTLLAQGNYREGQAVFRRLLEMKRGSIRATATAVERHQTGKTMVPSTERRVLRCKLVDRVEQIHYLIEKGLVDRSFEEIVGRCQRVLEARNGKERGHVTLPSDVAPGIESFCNSVIHYENAAALSSGALNGELDFRTLEDAYLSTPTPVVYFDDFLRPDALQALRSFSLESTIYFGCDPAGYVTSYIADGVNCSLLYQIADELKQCFPRVIGNQFLTNMWIYRHHERAKGVDVHTDYAAVSFNFWITPDFANLSTGRGGMVIYKKEEPLDWDWFEHNKKKNCPKIQERIRQFLGAAETVTIPYRNNRAILFHSNLFHRSDDFHFRDEFENRRMNITMLFGERSGAAGR